MIDYYILGTLSIKLLQIKMIAYNTMEQYILNFVSGVVRNEMHQPYVRLVSPSISPELTLIRSPKG